MRVTDTSLTQLSGPDFVMKGTVFITHADLLDLLDKLDVKIDAEHPGGWWITLLKCA